MIALAELAIRQEEMKPGFSVCLLQIVASEGFSRQVRLASALYFKNFIKRNWTVCANETLELSTWCTECVSSG